MHRWVRRGNPGRQFLAGLLGGVGLTPVLVIDGYNLIKRVEALAVKLNGPRGLEAARSYLLGWLRRNQASRHRRTILVLDGPRASRSDFGPVEVYYAPSADEVVSRFAGPGALVVTSDLELAEAARGRGAEILSSEDFWTALTARDRRPVAPRGGDDRDQGSGGGRGGSRGGNPRRRSKADRRRERERAALMRKI
jgi:predicted RNA-binding protein with PIN domain